MNTLPVRAHVGLAGVADALTAMRSQLAALLAHEHAPLVLARQASGIPAHLPLFTTFLNYVHRSDPSSTQRWDTMHVPGISLDLVRARTNYPLDVCLSMTPGPGSNSPQMRWRRLTRGSWARCCAPALRTTW